jgi:hypothetical protein
MKELWLLIQKMRPLWLTVEGRPPDLCLPFSAFPLNPDVVCRVVDSLATR